MVLKTSIGRVLEFFFIFLLISSQVIFVEVLSSNSNHQNEMYSNYYNPVSSFELLEPNDAFYGCVDLLVDDDFVIIEMGTYVSLRNISLPSYPSSIEKDPEIYSGSGAFTSYNNTVLFCLGLNYAISKLVIKNNFANHSEILYLNKTEPIQMSLTNDTLYCFAMNFYRDFVFLIFNATNINDLTLLGNTTISEDNVYYSFVVHENFIYINSRKKNLWGFQIDSNYQLSYISGLSFTQLESMYFHEDYLFACDNFGLHVFNNSNPFDLTRITQYNLSSAQSIRIKDNVGYLTTNNSFITLDMSNILDIQILDQYTIGEREEVELWKIEMSSNLAVVLTKLLKTFDFRQDMYGGNLYIFDVSSPNEIVRLYPRNIPLRVPFDVSSILIIITFAVIPATTLLISTLIFGIRYLKKKQQRKKDLSFED